MAYMCDRDDDGGGCMDIRDPYSNGIFRLRRRFDILTPAESDRQGQVASSCQAETSFYVQLPNGTRGACSLKAESHCVLPLHAASNNREDSECFGIRSATGIRSLITANTHSTLRPEETNLIEVSHVYAC